MHHAVTVLTQQGAGPVTVELEDGSEYEIELEESHVEEDGFHAEGRDLAADDVLYRFTGPVHDEGEVRLERRHARETDWTELGRVVEVDKES